ncbi:MAG TPA: hypothetical protein VF618_06230 [Thermoanaerobaculia bacterium]
MRPFLLLVLTVLTTPLFATYTARDLYVPVAGRITAADGREFLTTVSLTNPAIEATGVTISFLKAGQPNPAPRQQKLRLDGNESREIALEEQFLGALRIEADRDVLAEARVYSRANGAGFNAIPAAFAIGTGESAIVQGAAAERYRIYAVETVGHPLYVTATLLDEDGRGVAQKRIFLGPREQRTFELAELFPQKRGSAIRLTGFNGSGKIIATGAQVATESRDTTPFEMSFPTAPRHRVKKTEAAAYAAVALAIVIAAVRR